MWSEIVSTANVWTVMSSAVQMWKRCLIRSGPNVLLLSKLENGTTHIWDTGSFCKILNVADTFQKCKNNRVIKFLAFLTSVITVYLLKCLLTKYLIFLQVIRVFKFLLMGVPWQTRKYIRGSIMTKRMKSTDVGETHHISFEAPFALRLAGHIVVLFFRCFVCNLWFLFIVRVNVVSYRVTF